MIKENYVSFEIAKHLKEKGFDWGESPFYSEQDRDEWRQNNSYTIPNMEYNPDLPFDSEVLTLVAPHVSLQMAMKWLREVHSLYLDIVTLFSQDGICYTFSCSNTMDLIQGTKGILCHEYQTYEEACEAGIKYCLKNLI